MSDNLYSGHKNLVAMESAKNYKNYLLCIIKSAIKNKNKILDFGAGIGTYSIPLSSEGFDVSCVEVDRVQADIIKDNGLVVYDDIKKVDYESYDAVYSLNVIEHIEDDVGALESIKRILKKDGVLIIYVPAFNSLYSEMDKKVGHYRRYSKGELVEKLNVAGFKICEASYVDCLGYFASLVYKIYFWSDGSISVRSVLAYDKYIFPISLLIDNILGRLFGKNLKVIAIRDN